MAASEDTTAGHTNRSPMLGEMATSRPVAAPSPALSGDVDVQGNSARQNGYSGVTLICNAMSRPWMLSNFCLGFPYTSPGVMMSTLKPLCLRKECNVLKQLG